jgi:tetratricopeptide (TPR) repeat protein
MTQLGNFVRVLLLCAATAFELQAGQPDSICSSAEQAGLLSAQMTSLASASNWTDLEQAASRLIARCPQLAAGHYWSGVALLRQGQTFASIRELRRALESADTPGTRLFLAEAYMFLNQRKFFEEEIAQVLARAPEQPGAHYLAGLYAYATQENWEKAAGEFEQELRHNPEHFQAMSYLGLCYKASGQLDRAESTFQNAIVLLERKKMEFDLPYQLLAALYLDKGDDAKALLYAKRAAEIDPNSFRNRFLAGKAAWRAGDAATALRELQAAVALDGNNPEAHYILAGIYKSRGEAVNAQREIELFRKCKEFFDTN